jgi:hypothetical protein
VIFLPYFPAFSCGLHLRPPMALPKEALTS